MRTTYKIIKHIIIYDNDRALLLPIVVSLAVDVAIFGEARDLGVQPEVTIRTGEAVRVPLFLDGEQVVPV